VEVLRGGTVDRRRRKRRRNARALFQWLGEAEYILGFFTEDARTYWRIWGPLGKPIVPNLNARLQGQLPPHLGLRHEL
jgi:hypothetical protein